MKNKKAKTSPWIIIGGIALIAILAVVVWAVAFKPAATVAPTTAPNGNPSSSVITAATTLTVNGKNPATGGALTAAYKIAVGGESAAPYSALQTSTYSVSQGQKLDLLVNASGYHTQFIEGHVVPAQITDLVIASLPKNASLTGTMYNTNKVAYAVATQNLSAIAASGAATYEYDLVGTGQASTNDMRCILDWSAGSNVSTSTPPTFSIPGVTVASVSGNPKPQSYTQSSTGSALFVFDVSPITDASLKAASISVSANQAKTIPALSTLKVTCYSKENAIDGNTGKHIYSIEDSAGTQVGDALISSTFYYT